MQYSLYLQKAVWGTCFVCLLGLTFWLRIQGVERIPDGQFTGNDAYLYYKQAETIAERGCLPARDMDRWLPLGRDNGQLLSLYAYAIAYMQKVFPWWSLYQIQLYLPVLCFTLGLGVLFLFLTRCYGVMFATIVGVLLATFPGSISRSAAGFGDRDAWCWMLGVLAVTSYLYKEQMAPGWRRWLATALAGFTVFLGGLSWEAFGLFVLIILATELWTFCSTDTEKYLSEYLLYILMFVPWLYLISPAYHSGYGFAKHLFALTLAPPITLFALRGTRYLSLKSIDPIRPHARKLAGGLTVLAITAGITYIFTQADTFETTAFTLRESSLMKGIGELADPDFTYWTLFYGTIFVFGSIGIVLGCRQLGKLKVISLGTFLSVFTATTFFHEPLTQWFGNNLCNTLFGTSLTLTIVGIGIACLKTKDRLTENQRTFLLMLVWFLLWGSLARSGIRYSFFIGVPLAYGTAWLLCIAPAPFIQKLKDIKILAPDLREQRITTGVALAVLIPVLFWTPLGGHATRVIQAGDSIRKPLPGTGSLTSVLKWIKTTLPQNAVIAAHWGDGTQLNVLGGVKTITDPDHYLLHWIHLYYRHVFCAQSVREALEFLKTHGATHLMLTKRGVTARSRSYSSIGSDTNNDRDFRFYTLQREEQPFGTTAYRFRPQQSGTPVIFIDIHYPDALNMSAPETLSIRANFKGHQTILKTIPWENKRFPTQNKVEIHEKMGGILFDFDSKGRFNNIYYLPSIGWNSLPVKLFFRGEHSDAFVPVYPADADADADVKIWEIRYPADIKPDPKYLKTGFPEIDKTLGIP